jgi:hypothetical protein
MVISGTATVLGRRSCLAPLSVELSDDGGSAQRMEQISAQLGLDAKTVAKYLRLQGVKITESRPGRS